MTVPLRERDFRSLFAFSLYRIPWKLWVLVRKQDRNYNERQEEEHH